MAQTRSIGKAYRNLLGFIMKSAGYQDTPAEDMVGANGGRDDIEFQDAVIISKPTPNAKQMKRMVEMIQTGEPGQDGEPITLDRIKSEFNLMPDQEEEIKKLFK